ncbi:oligosaccharide flippase family protein [Porphyromonas bennonis]|uniref:oligosaccharide flippase family protein n=1 Tax=Porphyromonas bennonis TaxID=501496 RepID=UPI0003711036|nr:oligosaccharide flippase family protein [Porphyromonas bennonis]
MGELSSHNNPLRRLWSTAKGHRLILENFLSLGLINVLNSSFHLIIYPILIRRVGAETYGTYVYAFSIVNYFTTLVTYGLDMIGTRYLAIYDRDDDLEGKSRITSLMVSSKFYLALLALLIFSPIALFIESLEPLRPLLWANFLVVVSYIFMPGWYYIGIQNTRPYLNIQVITKILLVLAIIFLVIDASDVTLYALLVSINMIIFSLLSFIYIAKKEKLLIVGYSVSKCLSLLKESTPLFLSNMLFTVKSAGLNLVIGNMFGMTTLTGYDFSMKIVSNVTFLAKQLNTALFPSISGHYTQTKIWKLLKIESVLGITITALLILLAKPIIWIMGNGPIESIVLPLFIVLSTLVPTWLISGFFIELVLTANGKNREVFYNQLISLGIISVGVGIAYLSDVSILGLSVIVVLAGILEVSFLYWMARRLNLLNKNGHTQ